MLSCELVSILRFCVELQLKLLIVFIVAKAKQVSFVMVPFPHLAF